jgi:hypothetical protein
MTTAVRDLVDFSLSCCLRHTWKRDGTTSFITLAFLVIKLIVTRRNSPHINRAPSVSVAEATPQKFEPKLGILFAFMGFWLLSEQCIHDRAAF